MSTAATDDKFPRKQAYTRQTYDRRAVIGFRGYEAVQQADGSWLLIRTSGGHDSPPADRLTAGE